MDSSWSGVAHRMLWALYHGEIAQKYRRGCHLDLLSRKKQCVLGVSFTHRTPWRYQCRDEEAESEESDFEEQAGHLHLDHTSCFGFVGASDSTRGHESCSSFTFDHPPSIQNRSMSVPPSCRMKCLFHGNFLIWKTRRPAALDIAFCCRA